MSQALIYAAVKQHLFSEKVPNTKIVSEVNRCLKCFRRNEIAKSKKKAPTIKKFDEWILNLMDAVCFGEQKTDSTTTALHLRACISHNAVLKFEKWMRR